MCWWTIFLPSMNGLISGVKFDLIFDLILLRLQSEPKSTSICGLDNT